MSFLEWEDIERNPGPMGTVEVGARERKGVDEKPRWKVFLYFFISIGLLAAVYYFVFGIMSVPKRAVGITILITALYLMLGYFVHPDPNMKNVGWLRGLIDNPFRISDGWNRFLVFLSLILRPARFISESLVDFLVLLLHSHES